MNKINARTRALNDNPTLKPNEIESLRAQHDKENSDMIPYGLGGLLGSIKRKFFPSTVNTMLDFVASGINNLIEGAVDVVTGSPDVTDAQLIEQYKKDSRVEERYQDSIDQLIDSSGLSREVAGLPAPGVNQDALNRLLESMPDPEEVAAEEPVDQNIQPGERFRPTDRTESALDYLQKLTTPQGQFEAQMASKGIRDALSASSGIDPTMSGQQLQDADFSLDAAMEAVKQLQGVRNQQQGLIDQLNRPPELVSGPSDMDMLLSVGLPILGNILSGNTGEQDLQRAMTGIQSFEAQQQAADKANVSIRNSHRLASQKLKGPALKQLAAIDETLIKSLQAQGKARGTLAKDISQVQKDLVSNVSDLTNQRISTMETYIRAAQQQDRNNLEAFESNRDFEYKVQKGNRDFAASGTDEEELTETESRIAEGDLNPVAGTFEGIDTKNITNPQWESAGYYTVGRDAAKRLRDIEDRFMQSGADLYRSDFYNIQDYLPGTEYIVGKTKLKFEEDVPIHVQLYLQSSMQFIISKLRKQSGATINAGEIRTEFETFILKPGESKESLAAKRQGRAAFLQSLQAEAGQDAVFSIRLQKAKSLIADELNAIGATPTSNPAVVNIPGRGRTNIVEFYEMLRDSGALEGKESVNSDLKKLLMDVNY